MENNILMQKIIDNGLLYTPIVVPNILKDCLLILAHDKQGHNGFRRTYASLKNRYHWKGMKKSVHQHCTNCQVCAFLITTPAHGIHSNGLNRRITPSIRQRQQICPNSSMHAYRIYILHPTKVKTYGRHDKTIHRPHMLPLWNIKENTHRQWNQIQKQIIDRGV